MKRTFLQQEMDVDDSHVITSLTSCTTETTSAINNNEGLAPIHPPMTQKAISRSENSPYPTTFVQADSSNFKQVVQMLTGSEQQQQQQPLTKADPSPSPRAAAIPKKRLGVGVYERRNSLKNSLTMNTQLPGFSSSYRGAATTTPSPAFSPRNLFHPHPHEVLSPSTLDFPKLTLSSPVTPLNDNPFGKSPPSSEEDRAIAEKGFYFHPSPMNTPRDSEPQLLPLFPVTSPRISGNPS